MTLKKSRDNESRGQKAKGRWATKRNACNWNGTTDMDRMKHIKIRREMKLNRRIVTTSVAYLVSTIVIACLAGGCSTVRSTQKTGIEIPLEFRKTFAMLENIKGYRMPYFGGYAMDDKQVVLLSEKHNNAVVWNADLSGKSKVVDKNIFPEEFINSFFAKGAFNNVDTIFIQQGNARETFQILIHEGYHFYGKEPVMNIDTGHTIPRGTIYPENIEARYLMRAADKRLREKVEGVNKEGDREALFFFLQAVEKYPGDIDGNLVTAVTEGTASFVEHLFLAVANNPEIKNDKIAVAKAAYTESKSYMILMDFDKAYEYYQVASLPLYYLAVNNREALLERIFDGKHPLSLLQYIVTPKDSHEITDLKLQVTNYVRRKNETAKNRISAYQEKQHSENYTLVKIKQTLFPHAVQFEEFISFKVGAEYHTLNLGTTASAKTRTGSSFELREEDTLVPEGHEFFLLYVPKTSIREYEGKLNINSQTVVVRNANFEKENEAYIINE